MIKATKVNGVFDSDPATNPKAKKFDRLAYRDVLEKQLGVMDLTAISMCMDKKLPILVFELFLPGNLTKAVCGENTGTVIGPAVKP